MNLQLRLLEKFPSFNDMLFPNNMGHLQQVHTVHGYSALLPPSLFHWPPGIERPREPIADFAYSSEERGAPTGDLIGFIVGSEVLKRITRRPR